MYDELLINILKVTFVAGTISMFVILGFVKGRHF
ncbi:UNVERIFIED_ORG: hypothetical protein ABIC97_003195 [Peribacillus simplex]